MGVSPTPDGQFFEVQFWLPSGAQSVVRFKDEAAAEDAYDLAAIKRCLEAGEDPMRLQLNQPLQPGELEHLAALEHISWSSFLEQLGF